MIPLWLFPFAAATGNTFIVKPSEKTPLSMSLLAECIAESGIPDGVVNVINGGSKASLHLCRHPDIKAISFVGSNTAGEKV